MKKLSVTSHQGRQIGHLSRRRCRVEIGLIIGSWIDGDVPTLVQVPVEDTFGGDDGADFTRSFAPHFQTGDKVLQAWLEPLLLHIEAPF